MGWKRHLALAGLAVLVIAVLLVLTLLFRFGVLGLMAGSLAGAVLLVLAAVAIGDGRR